MQVSKIVESTNSTDYSKTMFVTAPADLAAGTWSVYIALPRLGQSSAVNVTVPYSVTSIAPASGSVAGGSTVTINGTGFSANADDVRIAIGNSPCTVTSASARQIVCTTGRAPGGLVLVGATVEVKPSAYAPLAVASGVTFSYVSAPVVTRVAPPRGSSAGGTEVIITGSGFTDDVAGVAMGDTACVGVTFVNATEIRCASWSCTLLGVTFVHVTEIRCAS
jgi:IPT/TIG domain